TGAIPLPSAPAPSTATLLTALRASLIATSVSQRCYHSQARYARPSHGRPPSLHRARLLALVDQGQVGARSSPRGLSRGALPADARRALPAPARRAISREGERADARHGRRSDHRLAGDRALRRSRRRRRAALRARARRRDRAVERALGGDPRRGARALDAPNARLAGGARRERARPAARKPAGADRRPRREVPDA